jgi:transcriptional regulator with XRE-family HTH domain
MPRKSGSVEDSGFGKRLENLMKSRKLTIRRLAEEVGIAHSTLGSWIAGTAPTDFKAVDRVARYLGTNFSYLLLGAESEPPEDVINDELEDLIDIEVRIKRRKPFSIVVKE